MESNDEKGSSARTAGEIRDMSKQSSAQCNEKLLLMLIII
jgi:hypothetical protein